MYTMYCLNTQRNTEPNVLFVQCKIVHVDNVTLDINITLSTPPTRIDVCWCFFYFYFFTLPVITSVLATANNDNATETKFMQDSGHVSLAKLIHILHDSQNSACGLRIQNVPLGGQQ